MELPIEIEWNIIKFMKHPLAEAFEEVRYEYDWSDNWNRKHFYTSFFRRERLRKLIKEEESKTHFIYHDENKNLRALYSEYFKYYTTLMKLTVC
jgi:hypothetical protein